MKEVFVNGLDDLGNGNKVIAPANLKNVKARFYGKNNRLIISANARKLTNLNLEFITDNSIILIGNCTITGTIRVGYNSTVLIGDNVTSTSPVYFTCAEETKLFVGDDCMFATHNQIRTDDAHAIYDIDTQKRLNRSKDVVLGAHVWVSYNAVIFGGTEINMGSIVGYGSFVKGKFANNVTVLGTPAKTSKENIAWERPNVLWSKDEYIETADHINHKIYWDKTDPELPIFLGDGCSHLLSYIQEYPQDDSSEPYFSIDFIHVENNRLFLTGNALLPGVECYEYNKAYKYSLKLSSDQGEFIFDLGKMSDQNITKKVFDGRHISYNKSKYTTLKNQGIGLNDIPSSEYQIEVIMQVNGNDYVFNILKYMDDSSKNEISNSNLKIDNEFLVLVIN